MLTIASGVNHVHKYVYWEAAKADVYGEEWWLENLRMSKATFGIQCNQLQLYIKKTVTRYCFPVAVDHTVEFPSLRSVAMVLYSVFVANRQMVTATCFTIVCRTTYAITQHLLPLHAKMPTDTRLREN